jgi:beta-lactamase class A
MLDPKRSNSATPRALTSLLCAIWRDEAASPASCDAMRRMLGFQVWPHRLASGFPYDDVRVSGKTGTLPTMRHEIGVVEYPDGGRYAVAVLTQSASTAATQPAVDAAIGTVGRAAVEHLRATRRP